VTAQPEILKRGGDVAVIGCGRPEHLAGFRDATGYRGLLFTDPALESFRAAGLAHGWTRTFHPLAILKGVGAFRSGFRQGARQGNPVQQGGTFVLGPGARVRFEWRDRFAGDHPDLRDVLAALGDNGSK
jgi:hypothetical protein